LPGLHHRPRLRPASRLLAASLVLLLATCCCARAGATQVARLRASFSPEHLGSAATISLGFQISSIPVGDSLPLTNVSVFLPSEMGIATSDLGLENCELARLEAMGAAGCPAASRMGLGTATAEIPIEGDVTVESARVEVFSARVRDGRLALMVYANAESPVLAQLVFPATVIPAQPPYSEGIDTNVPLVPTLPGAPDVAVTRFQMTLGSEATGPDHFVYYHWVHGHRVPYSPRGLILPPACPRGGFPFKALFTFQDNSVASARTSVPCPRRAVDTGR
jgi:hypothetical protein